MDDRSYRMLKRDLEAQIKSDHEFDILAAFVDLPHDERLKLAVKVAMYHAKQAGIGASFMRWVLNKTSPEVFYGTLARKLKLEGAEILVAVLNEMDGQKQPETSIQPPTGDTLK